ncbi:MAG: Glutamate carboxypeptidase [Acidobacteriales bacterium]|nr:Glutamate carboxypeptidase [Terriglobales bacterium]
MRRVISIALILQFFIPTFAQTQSATPASASAILGFTSANAATERGWEEKFRAIPSPENQRAYMEKLSARPHHVGSPYDKANAEWILSKFKEWGWDAQIESFDVVFPTPKTRIVEMLEPTRFTAKLEEPTLPNDPTTGQKSEQLPTYNAYSRDGDVTAPLVFVNYGVVEDYEKLQRNGVSVKGAIVIAKYGHSWRGIKPKIAAEHGAVGCLIYSDPADDGYAQDPVFPEGPMRPKDGVQRGSVMDMPQFPGDPVTPGVGATPNAKRIPLSEAPTISKIPVLPISYADAQPLLAALRGPVAPEEFRGGLPITYRLGPGPAKVHLKVEFNWDTKKVYDVIAKIPGAVEPDIWIVRGNHHDAWVNGAEDPTSGQVAMLEEARALGELLKQGWTPRRTIVYTAWDGEEPMLLGSTEWGEAHADELRQHAAAYINTDGNGRGYFGAAGSHSLESFINGVAKDITDPEKKIPVWKRQQAQEISEGDKDARKDARSRADLRIGALGSGSDYTVFIDFLGIATLNVGYGGEDNGGIYHSIYDDFYWFTHFSDTDFSYGRALSQTVGTAVMRLANADVVPLRFGNLSDTVAKYTTEVKKLLQDRKDSITEDNTRIDDGVFDAVSDPKRPTFAPPKKPVPPFLNFAPLDNALATLQKSAEACDKALSSATSAPQSFTPEQWKAINIKLIAMERLLTSDAGLPRRAWYKHLIYAPGWYTGYGAKTLPGIREGIEQERYVEADQEITRVANALTALATSLDELSQIVRNVSTQRSGITGGIFRVGGDVSAPKPVYTPDPNYTEEAAKAKLSGVVVLWVVVGPDGLVQDARVTRPLGHGLDETAVSTVRTWRFQPAMKDGNPVRVQMNVEVPFNNQR